MLNIFSSDIDAKSQKNGFSLILEAYNKKREIRTCVTKNMICARAHHGRKKFCALVDAFQCSTIQSANYYHMRILIATRHILPKLVSKRLHLLYP